MSHKIQFVRFSAINKNNSAMVKCVFCLKLYWPYIITSSKNVHVDVKKFFLPTVEALD